MKSSKKQKGFTLIELLVVVLIIGILAAIALPQYSFVVLKARANDALINAKSLSQSYKIWQLTTGKEKITTEQELSELDIILPSSVFYTSGGRPAIRTKYFDYRFNALSGYAGANIVARSNQGTFVQPVIYEITFDTNGKPIKCESADNTYSNTDPEIGKRICLSLGGVFAINSGGWNRYNL
jgi:prepilin-type N-terminal cleavage/methylation domain-containing protein